MGSPEEEEEADKMQDAEEDWEEKLSIIMEVQRQAEAVRERIAEEIKFREANVSAQQPTEEELKKFESSVKRNSALIKKLKAVTEESRKSLCNDILKVNQSRYVSEAVLAIAETPIKGKDMPAAVEVCATLHQRYSDFSLGIVDALSKAYYINSKGVPDDDKAVAVRKRSCLRLMVELFLAGVFQDISVLAKIVKDLVSIDYKVNPEVFLMNLMLLTSFAKVGREQILGLPQNPSLKLPGVPTEGSVPEHVAAAYSSAKDELEKLQTTRSSRFVLVEDHQKEFLNQLERVFSAACDIMISEHEKLRQQEQENTNVLNTKGELPEDLAVLYEKKRNAFESFQRNMSGYAESLDRDLPDLPKDTMTRVDTVQESVAEESTGPAPLFDDTETQAFYQNLPDLRAVVPAVLLGLLDKGEDKDKKDEKQAECLEENGEKQEIPKTCQESEKDKEKEEEEEDKDEVASSETQNKEGRSRVAAQELDALLSRLPTCVSRDGADEIAVNFCYINSKPARKKLVRALCDVPKSSLQLLPFYSRIAAILSQVFPEVSNGIVVYLEEEFTSLMSRKDASLVTLEPRIRNMRYMGELCKFCLVPFGTVFTNLKHLLDDFTHHNIDAACALIETAGGFLIRLPETHIRMENMLEQMTRLKNAKNLDSRHRALVDSAYFQCKPPKSGVRRKRRPPIHEYIRHLIYSILAEDSIRHVLKKLRRLPWMEYERIVVHYMVKATGKRFSHVSLVASLCAGLSKYHDTLAVAIVDEVLEEIQLGMEQPSAGLYQRRVAHVRLLGELYNYRLLDSRTVFEAMYWIMNFGKDNQDESTKLDGPGDTFRIRMLCTLLDTCGRYFAKGTAKRKLDRFLIFFQRYILSKPSLTMDMEFDLADLFERLRPDLKRLATFEESHAAVEAIEAAEAEHQDEESSSESDSGDGDSEDGLNAERSGAEDVPTEVSELDLDDDEEETVDIIRKQHQETDEEFERELKALLHQHQHLNPGMIPRRQVQSPSAALPSEDIEAQSKAVPFKMLMKKGGKDDRTKELQVPLTVSLAVQQLAQQDLEAQERSKIKELVLAANLKDEQEELQHAGIHVRRQSEPRMDRGGSFSYGGRRYSNQRKKR